MTKILLIESDKDACELLSQQLNKHGYDLIQATEGGVQGILLAIEHSPNLILVSTVLPKLSGWKVINLLRALPDTNTIPIIALTATLPDRECWMEFVLSGNDYCLKPIVFMKLLEKIEILLDSSLAS